VSIRMAMRMRRRRAAPNKYDGGKRNGGRDKFQRDAETTHNEAPNLVS
jgi:hypothetical protein